MKVLHITPNNQGYEEVELLANRVNPTNSMHMIVDSKGNKAFTGGFILNDTPEIRKVLDSIPNDKQYDFVKSFKMDPWVKAYYQE